MCQPVPRPNNLVPWNLRVFRLNFPGQSIAGLAHQFTNSLGMAFEPNLSVKIRP